jgi:hypothetical protein
MSTGGFADIVDDVWGDELGATEYVVGWLLILGTETDAGRYILKTMWCSTKGKLRQQEQEFSEDIRMPNFIHRNTMQKLEGVLAVLRIANVGDPVIGVGQKIADDVYWIEASYEKTLEL